MSDKYYLVNKLNHNLAVKQGYLNIEAFGYAPIFETDITDPTIMYVLGRDWAEIVSKEPAVSSSKKELKFDVTEPYKGMTSEELIASKAVDVKADPGISTALGQNTTSVLAENAATGTELGKEAEEAPKTKKKATA